MIAIKKNYNNLQNIIGYVKGIYLILLLWTNDVYCK